MKQSTHRRRVCGMLLGLDEMSLVRIASFTAYGLLFYWMLFEK